MKLKYCLPLLLLALAAAFVAFGCLTTTTADSVITYNIPEEPYPEIPDNPEKAIFNQSAKEFVANMGCGWNLGNTLDAYVTGGTTVASETCWGQPKTTQAMITGLKEDGIQTVRIPITWHNHVNKAFTVDPAWMTRVQEVVDYAINAGLYVIINIHHDNDPAYYFPDSAHAERSKAFVGRIWKQVANHFKNYNEHLIFETLNEPRLVGHTNEWNWTDSDDKLRDAAAQINSLNQLAVNTIRATGSNNANRFIMFTPYVASPWSAVSSYFTPPTDTAEDKLILSVHAYTPYNFAMESPGISTFGDTQKSDIDSFMSALNTTFVTGKNIPVVIGEYGATNKNNLAARVAYFKYYTQRAKFYGMCPIVWDNGNYEISGTNYNELYGYYNRTKQTWYFPEIIAAITGTSN